MIGILKYYLRAIQISGIVLWQLCGLGLDHLLRREGPGGPQRLTKALERMGGSFLKFGQILSLQIDQLPKEYCDALLDLLDRVAAFSEEKVRRVFDEELGESPDSLYEQFNYVPFAAASIGQVHRATLKDGTVAAVKVQRPGVDEIFGRDARLLNAFLKFIFFFRIRTLYFMRDPTREFNMWIQEELDYRREATHAAVLEMNAREDTTERVPRVYWPLTTARVLTMDFLEGYTVVDYVRMRDEGDQEGLQSLEGLNYDPAVFVSNVITNFMSDALRFGVFHADLHPANLLILKDNQVGYVDFGIVGTLSPEGRQKTIQLTLAYVGGRSEDIYASFLQICEMTEAVDLVGFRRELESFTRQWYREPAIGGVPHLQVSLNTAMMDLLTLCRSYGLLPRREMIRYIRSVVLADGLVSRLAPGLDYGVQLQKICEDYLIGEMKKKTISAKAPLPFIADFIGWLQTGPDSMLRTLEVVERGQLPVKFRFDVGSGSHGRFGKKTIWASAVWLVTLLWVSLNWSSLVSQAGSVPGVVSIAFLVVWTAVLFRLLTRPI